MDILPLELINYIQTFLDLPTWFSWILICQSFNNIILDQERLHRKKELLMFCEARDLLTNYVTDKSDRLEILSFMSKLYNNLPLDRSLIHIWMGNGANGKTTLLTYFNQVLALKKIKPTFMFDFRTREVNNNYLHLDVGSIDRFVFDYYVNLINKGYYVVIHSNDCFSTINSSIRTIKFTQHFTGNSISYQEDLIYSLEYLINNYDLFSKYL